MAKIQLTPEEYEQILKKSKAKAMIINNEEEKEEEWEEEIVKEEIKVESTEIAKTTEIAEITYDHCAKCKRYLGPHGIKLANVAWSKHVLKVEHPYLCITCFKNTPGAKARTDNLPPEDPDTETRLTAWLDNLPEGHGHPDWLLKHYEEHTEMREVGALIVDPKDDRWFDYEEYTGSPEDRLLMAYVIFEMFIHAEKSKFPNLTIWNRRRKQLMNRLTEIYSLGKEEVYTICGLVAADADLRMSPKDEKRTISIFFLALQTLETHRKQLMVKNNVAFSIGMDGNLQKDMKKKKHKR